MKYWLLDWLLPETRLGKLVRRLTPWWLLNLIMRHAKVCRANVVTWKMFDGEGWEPTWSCWDGPGEGYDYCGKWQTLEAFRRDTGCEAYRHYEALKRTRC